MADPGVERFYNEFSPRLIRDYVLGNRRVAAQLGLLRSAISPRIQSILIVGCGSGEGAHFVATRVARRARILAIDISPVNIDIAARLFPHERIEYRCCDILERPPTEKWDVIVLPDVYEHIALDQRRKLHSILDALLGDEGRLILTVPTPQHQAFLRKQGSGLQIIDELVSLDDLVALSGDVGGTMTYFNMICVWNRNDYIHATIEREAERFTPLSPRERIPIKGWARRSLVGKKGRWLSGRLGLVALAHALRRWRRQRRVRRRLPGLVVGGEAPAVSRD